MEKFIAEATNGVILFSLGATFTPSGTDSLICSLLSLSYIMGSFLSLNTIDQNTEYLIKSLTNKCELETRDPQGASGSIFGRLLQIASEGHHQNEVWQ
jgi:hypothetical protein